MVRGKNERVYGPYRRRNEWQVVFVDGDGRRSVGTFAEEGLAQAEAAQARAKLAGRKVSDAIAAYLEDGRARELRETSLTTTGYRLRTMFQVDDARNGGLLIEVTPARGRALFDAMNDAVTHGPTERPKTGRRSVACRRATLAESRTFARWCLGRGWLRADPFEGLAVQGRTKRGKRQLTIDQSRTFAKKALELVGAGDEGALASLLTLVEGCRASEVTDREVRDVDDDGAILWIRVAKTEAGERRLEVPGYLQAPLLTLCLDEDGKRRSSRSRVFGFDRTKPVDRHWLYYQVRRICRAAGVPEVCPQSLRGLHATLATLAGRTSHDVAAALGHESPAVTERHYTGGDALKAATQRRAWRVLEGGRAGEKIGPEPFATEKKKAGPVAAVPAQDPETAKQSR